MKASIIKLSFPTVKISYVDIARILLLQQEAGLLSGNATEKVGKGYAWTLQAN